MPDLGDTFPAGAPAPAAGTYQCSAPGCMSSFVASLAGAPLPSAHHAGSAWRLAGLPRTTPAAAKPASAAVSAATPAAPATTSPATGAGARPAKGGKGPRPSKPGHPV